MGGRLLTSELMLMLPPGTETRETIKHVNEMSLKPADQ